MLITLWASFLPLLCNQEKSTGAQNPFTEILIF